MVSCTIHQLHSYYQTHRIIFVVFTLVLLIVIESCARYMIMYLNNFHVIIERINEILNLKEEDYTT